MPKKKKKRRIIVSFDSTDDEDDETYYFNAATAHTAAAAAPAAPAADNGKSRPSAFKFTTRRKSSSSSRSSNVVTKSFSIQRTNTNTSELRRKDFAGMANGACRDSTDTVLLYRCDDSAFTNSARNQQQNHNNFMDLFSDDSDSDYPYKKTTLFKRPPPATPLRLSKNRNEAIMSFSDSDSEDDGNVTVSGFQIRTNRYRSMTQPGSSSKRNNNSHVHQRILVKRSRRVLKVSMDSDDENDNESKNEVSCETRTMQQNGGSTPTPKFSNDDNNDSCTANTNIPQNFSVTTPLKKSKAATTVPYYQAMKQQQQKQKQKHRPRTFENSSSNARNDSPCSFDLTIVTDISDNTSDSSVIDQTVPYTYKENTPVGICERIAKDDSMTPASIVNNATSTLQETNSAPFSFQKFLDLLEIVQDTELGVRQEEIENARAFRGANNCVSAKDSTDQGSAQYGRILPEALDRLFRDVMQIGKYHIFVDLGHGIGNACLQASYTLGCKSNGIELVDARFYASEAFRRCFAKVAAEKKNDPNWNHTAGPVDLKHGRLEDPAFREWLTSADRVFVNNYNDVFGSRSACKSGVTIDSRIAALFAEMKPGSVLATMHPIADLLKRDQDEVLELREKYGMDTPSPDLASFFKCEKIELGPANETVSWSQSGGNTETIWVWKYTRLEQPSGSKNNNNNNNNNNGKGIFLCSYKDCEHARAAAPIPAAIIEDSGLRLRQCKCNYAAISTRGRKNRKPSRRYAGFDCS